MRRKKLVTLLGSVCLVLVLASLPFMAACPAPVEDGGEAPPTEVIELKFASYMPAPHAQSLLLEEFCLELEERTNGQVSVDYYAGGSLLTGEAMFDGVVSGIADIGVSHVYYTPGRMSVTECCGLPLGYSSPWVSVQVFNDFYNEFKPAEFDDVKMLWMFTSSVSAIATADKPIHTLEDLKGLTLRSPGLSGEVIAALGATPTPTPMMEVYDAITKGEIDGESSNYETLKSFNFADVVSYVTSIWQINFPYPFFVVMNKDSYNALPADIKEVFDELCGEYRERSALVWNSIDWVGKDYALSLGVEFFDLSETEAARWIAAVAPVVDDYAANMVDKGYSEAEVRGWIDFLREREEYWTDKQIAWHIMSAAGPPEVTE
ncbi:Solute-binding protein [subsurface metagenome]|jgi:TRAP-type C4-dicarboxylate transport system substrate-binding protein